MFVKLKNLEKELQATDRNHLILELIRNIQELKYT